MGDPVIDPKLYRQPKMVAKHVVTGEYLRHDCKGFTNDRTWAWMGRGRQPDIMLATFPDIADDVIIVKDEE